MNNSTRFCLMIFCVIVAILLGQNSPSITIGLALLITMGNIWVNEICQAIRASTTTQPEPPGRE